MPNKTARYSSPPVQPNRSSKESLRVSVEWMQCQQLRVQSEGVLTSSNHEHLPQPERWQSSVRTVPLQT